MSWAASSGLPVAKATVASSPRADAVAAGECGPVRGLETLDQEVDGVGHGSVLYCHPGEAL